MRLPSAVFDLPVEKLRDGYYSDAYFTFTKDASGQHYNADAFRKAVLDNFNMSLGQGLSRLSGWVFRIGHLGDFNDLTLMGTLAGVEMGLVLAGVPVKKAGVEAAMDYISDCHGKPARAAA